MKIAMLLTTDRFSGAENVVLEIMELFRDSEEIGMVYVSCDGPIRAVVEKRGLPFYGMKEFSSKEVKRAVAALSPDLIHAHDFRASAAAASIRGVQVLSHLHSNPLWIRKPGLKTVVYLSRVKRFEKILTVSPAVHEEFWHGEKVAEKTVVLGNPFSAEEIRKKAVPENAGSYDLLFFGRMTDAKDPFLFLEIVAALRHRKKALKAIMIGDGELMPAVKQELTRLALNEAVTVCGFLENPYPVVLQAALLIMPSRFEGFGLAALEAMALKKPVICSGAGGLKDIVDDSCGRICRTIEDYVDAADELLSDEAKYNSASAGAFQRAELFSNLEEYRNKLAGIYMTCRI